MTTQRDIDQVYADLLRAVDWTAIHSISYDNLITMPADGKSFRTDGARWTIDTYHGENLAAEACLLAAGLVRDFTGADGQVLISADPERPLPAGLTIIYRADWVLR